MTQPAKGEALEEAEVSIDVTDLIGLYSNPNHVIEVDDGEVRQEFSICFRGHPLSTETRTSEESDEVLWVHPKEIDN
ncbi:hypothetical protein GCM10023148_08680 [Actinokineospora soli]